MGTLILLALGLAEMVLGVVIWHRAIPPARAAYGRVKAFKLWCLGMALVLFGLGLFWGALDGRDLFWMRVLGDGLLLSYGVLRYHHTVRYGPQRWGAC